MFKLSKIRQLKRLSAVNYSIKPAIKESVEDNKYDDQLKEFERFSNIAQKIRPKHPQKPPFVKNLFTGVFDTDILTYPELSKEDLTNLNASLEPVDKFLSQPEISECKTISRKFLQELGRNRLIGLEASKLLNGRALNATESCKFTESLSQLQLRESIIINEQIGIQILNKFGTDRQKRKYLEPLINGDLLSAFCVIVPSENNVYENKVTAVLSSDSKTWTLNGRKNLVINGKSADIFIVLAITDVVERNVTKENKFSVFIVERDFGGITSEPWTTLDSHLETTSVTFMNTPIPADNVIGTVNHGEKVVSQIYPEYRLSLGVMDTVIMKSLINKLVKYYLDISQEPVHLYETDAVRQKIAQFTNSLYVMESMIYLTSGLIDNYENQDCDVESAIVKIFTSEELLRTTTSCLDLLGENSLNVSHWCNQFHQEALNGITLHENNHNLKILITLFGLKHAGAQINTLVKKLRNPLFHALFIFKRMWTISRQEQDKPKLDLYLYQNLHQSCDKGANCLEYSVLRLKFAVEMLLGRNGPDVIERHMDLLRIADCVIDIYGMTAALGRASRAYCVGLQHGDYELSLAGSFCYLASDRVRRNVRDVVDRYQINDDNYKHIANRVFKFKQYFPVHPLSRNF